MDEALRHEVAVWMAVGWVCVWFGYMIQLFFHLRQEVKEEKRKTDLTNSYNHHTT
jgi:hypothetical protein